MKIIKVELVTGEIYTLTELKGMEEIRNINTGNVFAKAGDFYIRCRHDFKQAGVDYHWDAVVPVTKDEAQDVLKWNNHIVSAFDQMCEDFPNCSYKLAVGRKRGKVESI